MKYFNKYVYLIIQTDKIYYNMKKLDVLFLNPGDQVKTFQGLAKKMSMC